MCRLSRDGDGGNCDDITKLNSKLTLETCEIRTYSKDQQRYDSKITRLNDQ